MQRQHISRAGSSRAPPQGLSAREPQRPLGAAGMARVVVHEVVGMKATGPVREGEVRGFRAYSQITRSEVIAFLQIHIKTSTRVVPFGLSGKKL